MRDIVRRFLWTEDTKDGWGWRPAWNTWATTGSAMTVAHDVLEHRLRDKGSTEHEIRAFGAMVYMRAEGNYWGNYSVAEATCQELAELIRLHRSRGAPMERHAKQHHRTGGDAYFESMLDAAQDEFDNIGVIEPLADDERAAILGWLREGYRWCRYTYGIFGISGESAAQLFILVQSAVKESEDRFLVSYGGVKPPTTQELELIVECSRFRRSATALIRHLNYREYKHAA